MVSTSSEPVTVLRSKFPERLQLFIKLIVTHIMYIVIMEVGCVGKCTFKQQEMRKHYECMNNGELLMFPVKDQAKVKSFLCVDK